MSKQNCISSKTSLSQEWVCRQSKSHGKEYYFNTRTGKSTWTTPVDYNFKESNQVMESSQNPQVTRRSSNIIRPSTSKTTDCHLHEVKKPIFKAVKSPKVAFRNAIKQEQEKPYQVTNSSNLIYNTITTPVLSGNSRNRRQRRQRNAIPQEKKKFTEPAVNIPDPTIQKCSSVPNVHQLKVMELCAQKKKNKKKHKKKQDGPQTELAKPELKPVIPNINNNKPFTSRILNFHQLGVLKKLQRNEIEDRKTQPGNQINTAAASIPNKTNANGIINRPSDRATIVFNWKKLPKPVTPSPSTSKVWTLAEKSNLRTPIQEKKKPLKRLNSTPRSCKNNAAEERLVQLRKRLSLPIAPTESDTPNQTIHTPKTPKKPPANAAPREDFDLSDEEMCLKERLKSFSKVIEKFQDTCTKIVTQQLFKDLSTDANLKNDSSSAAGSISSLQEEMDWETVVAEINQARGNVQTVAERGRNSVSENSNVMNESISNKNIFIVVDTNIFISHLNTLQMLSDSSVTVNNQCVVIMVPWRVLCELDNLKSSSSTKSANIELMARKALRYLHDNLSSNRKMKGQSLKDASDHKFPCNLPDDEILNCCLQLIDKGEDVILVSNDINLCNKGIVNNIKTYTHTAFKRIIENGNTAKSNCNVNMSDSNRNIDDATVTAMAVIPKSPSPPKTIVKPSQVAIEVIEALINDLLSKMLKDEMIKQYDNLWLSIVLIKPPWALSDALECILKHWIAVFSDVLSSDAQMSMKELQNFFPPRRKRKEISTNINVRSLVELGTALCNCLKRNNKYSASAKDCSQKITEVLHNLNNGVEIRKTSVGEKDNTKSVVYDIFRIIWNGLSIFCGNLASSLGVPHSIQIDSDTSVQLSELISEANAVNNQLTLITDCIKNVLRSLNSQDVSMDSIVIDKEEASRTLYNILVDTVRGMGHNELIFNEKQIMTFCLNHMDVIENGNNDFMMLQRLLKECSDKYNTQVL